MLTLRTLYSLSMIVALAGLSSPPMAFAQQDDRQPQNERLQDKPADQPSSDRFEARRAPIDQKSGVSLQQAIIDKLQQCNQSEIELVQMAQQRIDHEELQQYTQTVIKDHKGLHQELEKLSQQVQDRGSQSAQVPQQLCALMQQAAQNNLDMTKQMLQRYEGQDFQMAFLGQQIFGHTGLLAELQAIQSTGPEQLHQIAGQAEQKVQQHLQTAKQIAQKLEDQERGGDRLRSRN